MICNFYKLFLFVYSRLTFFCPIWMTDGSFWSLLLPFFIPVKIPSRLMWLTFPHTHTDTYTDVLEATAVIRIARRNEIFMPGRRWQWRWRRRRGNWVIILIFIVPCRRRCLLRSPWNSILDLINVHFIEDNFLSPSVTFAEPIKRSFFIFDVLDIRFLVHRLTGSQMETFVTFAWLLYDLEPDLNQAFVHLDGNSVSSWNCCWKMRRDDLMCWFNLSAILFSAKHREY